MRLKSISLSKLLQAELVRFVDDGIESLERFDMRALHLENSSEMLMLHYPEVRRLAIQYPRCSITEKLKSIHIKRVEYAGYIFTQVLSLEKLKGNSMKKEALRARLAVRLHLHAIRKDDRPRVDVRIWGFFDTLDNNPEVKEAFEVLGLLSYVEEFREINKSYHEVYELRVAAKVEKAKRSENKRIQKKAEDIFRIFFAQLKQAQETYPELKDEYAHLYAELNHIIPRFTKLIRTRATLNKKRAAAKAKAEAKAKSILLVVCVDGKETGLVTIEETKKAATTTVKKGKREKKKQIRATHKKKPVNAKKE